VNLTATVAILWAASAATASFAWVSRFGFPHSHGHASMAACVVTVAVALLLGVVFAISAVLEGSR
jgi:hypothetical protein